MDWSPTVQPTGSTGRGLQGSSPTRACGPPPRKAQALLTTEPPSTDRARRHSTSALRPRPSRRERSPVVGVQIHPRPALFCAAAWRCVTDQVRPCQPADDGQHRSSQGRWCPLLAGSSSTLWSRCSSPLPLLHSESVSATAPHCCRGQGTDRSLFSMGHSFFLMYRIASRSGLLGRRCFSSATKGGPSIAGVGDIIAVASGKGGVGKSTTAVNISVALAKEFKLRVGLLDADIYGPSIPTMMNLHAKPEVSEDMKMIPVENHGVRCMSIGFLVDKDAPIVWRGPMVMSALEKMTRGVAWGDLDILVVDMPPGTGDAQLSMSQRLRLSGALIVSTPQDIALIDARRGANMFRKVQVPILGLVENMSCFKCPKCGEKSYIFGEGGAQRTAEEMDMKLLGDVPLEISIRTGSDEGKPIVVSSPNSASAQAYVNVAEKVTQRLKELAEERQMGPEILL